MKNRFALLMTRYTYLFVAFAALSICFLATAAPLTESNSITLVDVDGTETTFDADAIAKMPQETEENCICVGESAGFLGTFDYTGVRLSEILESAEATKASNDNKRENIYAVFIGTDGYQVMASWTELTVTSAGARVLIALKKDGEDLIEKEGKYRLILPRDKYVGRSVKCLERIELRVADGYKPKSKR
jgi:DMSO/TMAO reductase YedYZ molybdopterin-dependent catalytic subunit